MVAHLHSMDWEFTRFHRKSLVEVKVFSQFACNTRVIVDVSSSPPVSHMSNSCNKTLTQINKQTNLNQHHIISQSNGNSIRW